MTPDPRGAVYAVAREHGRGRFLIEGTDVARAIGADGRRYWVVDEDGAVLATYAPSSASDAEMFYATSYERRDGTLLEMVQTSVGASALLPRWQARVVVDLARAATPDEAARVLARWRPTTA